MMRRSGTDDEDRERSLLSMQCKCVVVLRDLLEKVLRIYSESTVARPQSGLHDLQLASEILW